MLYQIFNSNTLMTYLFWLHAKTIIAGNQLILASELAII